MKWLRSWSLRHARGLANLYRRLADVAPALAPLVRRMGAARVGRFLLPLERHVKSAFFDCRMCGDCRLSVTGMACPMGCGKQMRNGPCGGVRADGGCEVSPAMRCVWLDAAEGDRRIAANHTPTWRRRVPPVDWRLRGQSTWLQTIVSPPGTPVQTAEARRMRAPASAFERACAAWRSEGRLVVTVEIAPPDSPDRRALLERAQRFDGLVDAINITDGAGANCHMSSVAAAAVLAAAGLEAVCQVGCRDRNRIAVQGDVLGAAALGVRNVLCLTGDDVSRGDHPQAKPVFDLDAVNLLHILRGMRDEARYASGRPLEEAPPLFLGATANPFVAPWAERVDNLERKIDAGAQFVQTQFCFDLKRLDDFMRAVRDRGLHQRAAILVGVGTLSSAKALRWMAEHVPGVHVPDAVVARVAGAADQRAEGLRLAVETIRALRDIEGVAGVHLMGHRNEDSLARIVVDAGLRTPHPAVAHAA